METTAMRNVTPIITPSRVKKLLSFCTQIVFSASRIASTNGMARRLRGQAELLDERRPSLVAVDHAVAEHDDAPRVRGDVGLVRHHDDGLALVGEALEHLHDLFRRG